MTISSAVILVHTPFTRRDVERFDVAGIRRRGVDLVVCDVTRLLSASYLQIFQPPDPSEECKTVHISRWGDLFRFILSHRQSLFIDTVDIHRKETVWIKLLFLAVRIRYLAVELNYLPDLAADFRKTLSRPGVAPWLRRLFNVLRDPGRVVSILLANVNPRSLGYAIVCGLFARRSVAGRGFSNIIDAHTMDYDLVLRREIASRRSDENYVVFLDEYFPYHPDFILEKNWSLIEPDRYYADMRGLFDAIERAHKCRVIVAAHPRAHYENLDSRYGGREIRFGQTAELIASASFVVTHMSTAVNFAVIFRKPLLFITSAQLDGTENFYLIRALARWFGLEPINANVIGAGDMDIAPVKDSEYAHYFREFIKVPGSPEAPLWDIALDAFSGALVAEAA